MADVTIVAASVRQVTGDPEDQLTYDAASGYTPALGNLVAISGNNAVDKCDATDANALVQPVGVVTSIQATPTGGYRVTATYGGLVEGFTGLTAKTVLYNSATPGAISDTDPSGAGVTGLAIGVAVNATQVLLALPSL